MTRSPIADRGTSTPKRLLLVLVHSNVFISIAATSVVVTTVLLLGLPFDPLPPVAVFAATLLVYNANRLTDLAEDERNVPDRAAFARRYARYLLTAGAVLYLLATAVALALSAPGAPLLLLVPLVAVAYSSLRLKRIFLVKNLAVGLAWGLLPLGVGVYYEMRYVPEVLALFAYVTAMLTVAAVIFDVKDIEGDRAEGIDTVPVRVGPSQTRQLAAAANALVAVAVAVVVLVGPLPSTFLVLLAMNAYVGSYVPFATPDRSPLFYGLIVDGEHVFLALCVVLLKSAIW